MPEQVPLWVLIAFVLAQWIFGALVQALPDPTEKSSIGYRVVYALVHGAAANIGLVRKMYREGRKP